jgi:hypothetical protein
VIASPSAYRHNREMMRAAVWAARAAALMSGAEALSLQACLAGAVAGFLATEIGAVVFDEGVGTFIASPLVLVVGVLPPEARPPVPAPPPGVPVTQEASR